TSVDNEGPESPPQSNFEPETAVNTTPADGILGSTEFNGSNTTARFTGTTTIVDPDGSDTGIVGIANNDGDSYSELSQAHETTQVGQVERMDWDLGRFILQTEAPGGRSADWDGTRIYLYEGETITMAPHSADLMDLDGGYIPTVAAIPADGAPPEYSYWMGIDPDPALDTDTDPGLGDPLFFYRPDGAKFDWEVLGLSQNGSISYEVPDGGTGWYYLGIGNISGDVTPEGLYRTEVEIDGVPYGEFDYTATDYVLSDGAHVTVDAIDERYYDNGEKKWVDIDTLNGTSGDDIIISGDSGDTLLGNDGMDVLIGRGGDDHLTGGDGSDLFLFEHAETTATTPTDGHDTIYNFSATDGDIINLDALFDELGVLSADREGNLLADNSSGVDTVLTVEDAGGTVVSGFSITLDGSDFDNADIAQLITDGNLVVDQS
ncbi:MAG: type I secretion C-terminal target domain-containing protein, partial [Gammaproteobacteria bacterium]|nr:type I secretion C-terminal target domain-containing protein [Gammaproteobacteria bacterium]